MLCEYLSLPCFVLVRIWDNLNSTVLRTSTDRMSCEQRCGKIRLDVPSFESVINSDWNQIYSQCQDKYVKKLTPRDHLNENEICTFPINAKYSFGTHEWFDKESNEVLNLPWKGPETAVGPTFYPIMNDVLFLAYHDWSSQFKIGSFSNGFKFQQYDSKRCEKYNNHFESVKTRMSYPQRYEHQSLYEANANYLCKELSFYCVNQKSEHISGPWEGTLLF